MSFELTTDERNILTAIQEGDNPAEARRATIILLSGDGLGTADIARRVALSPSTVRRWRHAWTVQRMAIFPAYDETGERTQSATTAAEEAPPPTKRRKPRPGEIEPRLPLELRETPGVLPDDPIAEAGRKVLRFHFERMLLNEPASRLGEDIEAVHDMRVATRRMRSAFRLFGPYYEPDTIAPLVKGLKRIARTLGEVRDRDVFRDKAQQFAANHPGTDLSPFFADWETDYQVARLALLVALDGKPFARFVKQLHRFVTTDGVGARPVERSAPEAYQVRHVAPRLIYEHYEQVRAFEPVLNNAPMTTLHALRIAFKRLRYTIEFFVEVLGSEATLVIEEIKTMQDHLGDLNDTGVAKAMLGEFIDAHNRQYSGVPHFMRPDISGVMAYAAAQAAEQERLLNTFPQAWAQFNRDEIRRSLALAVAAL